MNKKFWALVIVGLAWTPFIVGFQMNGVAPGSAASPTAVACPTASTAAKLLACQTSTTCRTKSITFHCIGTANCYVAPASAASPCASASPAPNATTKIGIYIPGNTSYTYKVDKYINPSDPTICAEWDMSCDAASNFMSTETIP